MGKYQCLWLRVYVKTLTYNFIHVVVWSAWVGQARVCLELEGLLVAGVELGDEGTVNICQYSFALHVQPQVTWH